MNILYLSDGEGSAIMTLSHLLYNLVSADDVATVDDIIGALDSQGFWHGFLAEYNVAIVSLDKIEKVVANELLTLQHAEEAVLC